MEQFDYREWGERARLSGGDLAAKLAAYSDENMELKPGNPAGLQGASRPRRGRRCEICCLGWAWNENNLAIADVCAQARPAFPAKGVAARTPTHRKVRDEWGTRILNFDQPMVRSLFSLGHSSGL
jgi:hypothetical protein